MWEKNIAPEQTYLYSIDSNKEIKKQDADKLKSYDVKTKEGRKSARAKVLELEKNWVDVSNIINTLNILDWQSWQTQKRLKEISVPAEKSSENNTWLEEIDFGPSPSISTPQPQPVEQSAPVVTPVQQPVETPQPSQQSQTNSSLPYAWRHQFNDTPVSTVESNNTVNNGTAEIYNVSPGNSSVPTISNDVSTFQPQTEEEILLLEKNEALRDLIKDITIDWTFRWRDLAKIRNKLINILIKESKWEISPEDAKKLADSAINSLWEIERSGRNKKRGLWDLFDNMLDRLEKQPDGTVTTKILDQNNQYIVVSFQNETEALEKIAAMKKEAENQLQTVLQNLVEGTITHFIWNAIMSPINATVYVHDFMEDNASVNSYFDAAAYWIFWWLVGWATLWLEVSTIRYAWRLAANSLNFATNNEHIKWNLFWLDESSQKLKDRKALLERIETLKDLYPNGSPEHTRLSRIHERLSKYVGINTKTFDNIVDSELLTDKKFGRFFKFFKNALQLESPLFKSNTWGERGKRIINPFQRSSEEYIWKAWKKLDAERKFKMYENKARLSVELSELSATDKKDLLKEIDDASNKIKDNINSANYGDDVEKVFKDILKNKNIELLNNNEIRKLVQSIEYRARFSIENIKTSNSTYNFDGFEKEIKEHSRNIIKEIANGNHVTNIEEWFQNILNNKNLFPNGKAPSNFSWIKLSTISEIEQYATNKSNLRNIFSLHNNNTIEHIKLSELRQIRKTGLQTIEDLALKALQKVRKVIK